MPDNNKQRIIEELRAAGVTRFGMKKFAIKYLPKVLHGNEHIGGVVYGRYRDKSGGPKFNEGLLLATNLRVVFLDHKPGFTDTTELTYDVVAGVHHTKALFSAITLNTRLGDFTLTFVNPRCADTFVHFVEKRRLEAPED